VEPVRVNCLDTTGAGDLYAAGFLYGFANSMDVDRCGVIGSLLAGKVIEEPGAKISPQTWDFIRKNI
jgi:sugar/nucleoside kinase (ribokinase family)